KRTRKRRGKRYVAVHYRHGSEARAHLDQFHLQAFLAKEALVGGNVQRRDRVAAARVGDSDFLCLRDRHVGENTAERKRRKNREDKKSKLHRASRACHAFHLFEELAKSRIAFECFGEDRTSSAH